MGPAVGRIRELSFRHMGKIRHPQASGANDALSGVRTSAKHSRPFVDLLDVDPSGNCVHPGHIETHGAQEYHEPLEERADT